MNRLLCTRQETAELLGVGISSVDLLIKRHVFRPVHVGHRPKISRADIDRFIRNGGAQEVWPQKHNGKTTRQVSPPMKKPLIAPDSRADHARRESA